MLMQNVSALQEPEHHTAAVPQHASAAMPSMPSGSSMLEAVHERICPQVSQTRPSGCLVLMLLCVCIDIAYLTTMRRLYNLGLVRPFLLEPEVLLQVEACPSSIVAASCLRVVSMIFCYTC